MADVLSQHELEAMDAYWRAANYLSVGQMYLCANPLLTISMKGISPIASRSGGGWGAVSSASLWSTPIHVTQERSFGTERPWRPASRAASVLM